MYCGSGGVAVGAVLASLMSAKAGPQRWTWIAGLAGASAAAVAWGAATAQQQNAAGPVQIGFTVAAAFLGMCALVGSVRASLAREVTA